MLIAQIIAKFFKSFSISNFEVWIEEKKVQLKAIVLYKTFGCIDIYHPFFWMQTLSKILIK